MTKELKAILEKEHIEDYEVILETKFMAVVVGNYSDDNVFPYVFSIDKRKKTSMISAGVEQAINMLLYKKLKKLK